MVTRPPYELAPSARMWCFVHHVDQFIVLINDPAAREAAGLADKAPGLAGKAGNQNTPRSSQSKDSQHARAAAANTEGHMLLPAEAELAGHGDSENMPRTARSSVPVKTPPAVPSLVAGAYTRSPFSSI